MSMSRTDLDGLEQSLLKLGVEDNNIARSSADCMAMILVIYNA